MRIAGTVGPDVPVVTSTDTLGPTASAPVTASTAVSAPMQSNVLRPALSALGDMPDVDQAKVDAVRAALARGEARFDATRLAALIERFHGGTL